MPIRPNDKLFMLSLIYPMGTGMDIKVYPLNFAGTGVSYSFGYCQGRVFALPAPYQPVVIPFTFRCVI